MRTSMYTGETMVVDLREQQNNFLSFIVMDSESKNHVSYPFMGLRMDIVSDENLITNAGTSAISIAKSGIEDVQLVLAHIGDKIEIANISVNPKVEIRINGDKLEKNGRHVVGKKEDFCISIHERRKTCCILVSSNDYSNRDWESYPLYDTLTVEKSSIVTVGRAKGNMLQVDNHTVSRNHGFFQMNQNKIFFFERSENPLGNRINGKVISKSCELTDKSILLLATAAFIYVNGMLLYSPFNNGCELELSSVHKSVRPAFGKKIHLLKNVNMTIPGNSLVAIMGPSGAGKSTLIDLIRKNERLTSGSIKLNGVEITRAPEFQNCMGYVHQNNLLREKLKVYECIWHYAKIRLSANIDNEDLKQRIEETLDKMNLSKCKNSNISVLSGGQKKKVAIACELVCDPQVLFLDEPTSGLDPDSEAEIMKILKELTMDKRRGKTIFVITHSLMHFNDFDKIVFVGKDKNTQTGYLCYYGNPTGIFSHFNVDENDFIGIYEQAVALPDVTAKRYLDIL